MPRCCRFDATVEIPGLPREAVPYVTEAIMAEVDKGASLDGTGMMTALSPLMQQMAAVDPSADSAAFMNFGMPIGGKIEKAFIAIGEGFADAARESFVVAVRRALRVASIVLLAGARLSLLIRPGKNVASARE